MDWRPLCYLMLAGSRDSQVVLARDVDVVTTKAWRYYAKHKNIDTASAKHVVLVESLGCMLALWG